MRELEDFLITECFYNSILKGKLDQRQRALQVRAGDGMGWDGMGWDGMGWDGMGWDGMGWAQATGDGVHASQPAPGWRAGAGASRGERQPTAAPQAHGCASAPFSPCWCSFAPARAAPAQVHDVAPRDVLPQDLPAIAASLESW